MSVIGQILPEREARPAPRARVRVFAGAIGRFLARRPREARVDAPYLPMPRWKRAMDIAGAIAGLILTFPILVLVAILIRLTSRGDAMFRQTRTGLNGRPFVMFKLRTMVHDADEQKPQLLKLNERDGPAFKMKHDPRVTRFGRLLRRTSFDELPQLWNVLKGEMSLVGPRPLPCDESAACDQRQQRRLVATPGITCIWQITSRAGCSFEDWLRMDMRYIARRTLVLDLLILARTIPAIVFRGDAT